MLSAMGNDAINRLKVSIYDRDIHRISWTVFPKVKPHHAAIAKLKRDFAITFEIQCGHSI
jgi:hypothetical protein